MYIPLCTYHYMCMCVCVRARACMHACVPLTPGTNKRLRRLNWVPLRPNLFKTN